MSREYFLQFSMSRVSYSARPAASHPSRAKTKFATVVFKKQLRVSSEMIESIRKSKESNTQAALQKHPMLMGQLGIFP